MHLDLLILLTGAAVGLLVGMTGSGGGALMTPMLILLFGIAPAHAISSDLMASVLMRPVGSAVHLRARTVNMRLVLLLSIGSVPGAFVGSFLLGELSSSTAGADVLMVVLGATLLAGAGAMALRSWLDRRRGHLRDQLLSALAVRPVLSVLIGLVGGVLVGMTSVGAGSLVIVLLLFVYPGIGARQLVGTDLTAAVPLTLAAVIGSAIFGTLAFGVTFSLILGSVPAAVLGATISSRVSDRLLRPLIGLVVLASGLKYVGVGTTALGVSVAALIAAAGVQRLWRIRLAAAGTT